MKINDFEFMVGKVGSIPQNEIHQGFRSIDIQNKGYITFAEFQQALYRA